MKMKKWQALVLFSASLVCLSACKNQMTSEADKQNGDRSTQISSQTSNLVEKKLQTLNFWELMGKRIIYLITRVKRFI